MKPEISFHDQALADLEEAVDWYKSITPELSARLLSEIREAKSRLEVFPNSGSPFHEGTRRILLKKFPYVLVYLNEPGRIEIIAVMHTSRKPGYWADRLNPDSYK